MTRQTLTSNWVRIGRGSLRKTTLIVVAASAVIALFITAPMAEFGPIVFGVQLPIVVPYAASVLVVFLMFAPIMLPRATRPLYVDSAFARVRVGLRTMPVDELRHAYRLPDPLADGRFQLRLGVRGLDALIGISPSLPAELSPSELDALITLIERAPIEADPATLLRPPLGDELGRRSDAERFDDELGRVLMPYELTSFAKPTLLAELRSVREVLAGWDAEQGQALLRDIGVVAPYTTNAPGRQAALAKEAVKGPVRGFWATQSSRYRAQRTEVENWLRPLGFEPRIGWHWWLGLAVAVGGVLSNPICFALLSANVIFFANPAFANAVGPLLFFILTWPFILAAGLMLMWRGRIARFERARAATLAARRTGTAVPDPVAAFFGAPFVEVAFVGPLAMHLIIQFIVLLAGGITLAAVSRGSQLIGLGFVVGIAMIAGSVLVFTFAVRRIGSEAMRSLRARAIWQAISS